MATPSPRFLTKTVYGSYLIYPSPATDTDTDQEAKSFILGVKQDRVTARGRLIEIAVTELKRSLPQTLLAHLLDGKAILVPIPNHALRTRHGAAGLIVQAEPSGAASPHRPMR